MKLASETISPNAFFPTILNKSQSGNLFSKSNLLSSLNPEKKSEEESIQFDEAISNIKTFKQYLLQYYKNNSSDAGISESTVHQIEFIFDLFVNVHNSGGWSYLNGTNN